MTTYAKKKERCGGFIVKGLAEAETLADRKAQKMDYISTFIFSSPLTYGMSITEAYLPT